MSMIIIVDVNSHLLEISLGSGSQTFKWLGQIVSARLKSQNILRHTFNQECRHVVSFRNKEGGIINPNDSICGVAADRDIVYADVVDHLPSGTLL